MSSTKLFRDYLDFFLTQEERNPSWLSKKIGCSHTLVHNWLSGKSEPSDLYLSKLNSLYGDKYEFKTMSEM